MKPIIFQVRLGRQKCILNKCSPLGPLQLLKMAGKDIVKSSKSSFMSDSPKPKQASILNFFGSQKQQQPNSSPLSKIVQKPISFPEENLNEFENIPFELFENQSELVQEKDLSKKICIDKSKPIQFDFKISDKSTIVAPKILQDLNEAASIDFDISESSSGRYQWLVDLKDIDGHKKGKNLIRLHYFHINLYRRRII